jgi:hypothetical protein
MHNPNDPLLFNYLRKGTFPGLDSFGTQLWDLLITLLERDCPGTVKRIKDEMEEENRVDMDVCYPSEITVNKVPIDTGRNNVACFLGEAHKRLCRDHGVASKQPVQGLIQRLRAVAEREGVLPRSHVVLTLDPDTDMGNGLVANPLTYQPDRSLRVTFGSTPDQEVIGNAAPIWKSVKRRTYEYRGGFTQYGKKPHYVLAHMLNHNLNGPGDNKLNVVPFWGGANTDMAAKVEKHVKDLVQQGVTVNYTINQGPAVGMTTGRQKAYKAAPTKDQKELIDWEQYLPEYLIMNCDALDGKGNWVTVVNNVRIDNFVPETVPLMWS